MKNFRKVLALVLVVATLFSFVAMASAKKVTDYKDYADINYVEAVGVLTSVGINEGHDTGYFAPTDTIDRDEVAAMIARLRNGGTLNADLYVGADKVFADVKGQWSEGYVTYCAQLGIIDGRNASTFDPDGKVTGVETMKMLLCVLGYDKDIQSYTGANWQVNVIRDAKKAGLLIDGVDPYKAATREEVAQYFLNAIEAYMVIGYLGEGIVKVTNSIWAEGIMDLGIVTPDSIKAEYELTYKNAMISRDQLAESLGLEVKYAEGWDCYMRPANIWYLNGKEIGTYAIAPSAKWVSADEATIAKTADPADATVYVNGHSWAPFHTGNGVVVEYFADQDRFVVIDTFIGEVANISEYYGTFDIVDITGAIKVEDADLASYDVAEGDMVLYWICNGNKSDSNYYLHNCEVVEPINADVTEGDVYAGGYLNPSSCFVAGGKTYNYAWNLGNSYDPTVNALNMKDVIDENNYNIYLDKEGFVIYLAPKAAETAPTKYAYVVEKSGWMGNYHETVAGGAAYDYTVDMVKFADKDGALAVEKDVASDKAMYDISKARFVSDEGVTGDKIGVLVSYTDSGVATYKSYAAYASKGTMLSEGSWVLKEGEVYATSKTVFMIRTMNLDGTYSYEQVTGYENLDGTYIAETVLAAADQNAGNVTNIQYFADAKGFATYVFIDAKAQVAEADHFLILDPVNYVRFQEELKNVYGKDYLVFDAIVDGERAVIASHKFLSAGEMYDDLLTFRGFVATVGGEKLPLYVYADYDADAKIDAVEWTYEVAGDEVYIKFNNVVKKLAADAKIFVVDKKDGATVVTEKLFPELLANDTQFAYIYLSGNLVSELYVMVETYFA